MMSVFSTPAILIRRIDHGDFDLILTFLTLEKGKLTTIAKYAKKSVKRFAGVLELFTFLDVICTKGKGKLPVLKEASLLRPFVRIRSSIEKTAYASYWSQLLLHWMEEGIKDEQMFELVCKSLEALDQEVLSPEAVSILFQMKFVSLSGVSPNLDHCGRCGLSLEKMPGDRLTFDLSAGALFCGGCGAPQRNRSITLSRGSVKQLRWIGEKPAEKAFRIRCLPGARRESLEFLESFVSYHLGIRPKSLSFLRKLRSEREKNFEEKCACE